MYQFSEPRSFKVWMYTVSHRTLILRSEQQHFDVEYENSYSENVTIDLEFSGVSAMDLDDNFVLRNISIKEMPQTQDLKSIGRKTYLLFSQEKVMKVVAQDCIVGKSLWTNMNRIINPNEEYFESEHI